MKKKIAAASASNRFLFLALLIFIGSSFAISHFWPDFYNTWPSPLRDLLSYTPALLGFGLMSFLYMRRHSSALLPDQPLLKKSQLPKVMLMAVCGILVMIPINLLMQGLGLAFHIPESTSVEVGEGFSGLLLGLVVYAFLPAVVEEYMFRGILMRANQPNLGKNAIVYTALIFSLVHGNLLGTPALFVIGVFLGIVLRETGSLFLCMVYHMTHNGLAVLMQYIFSDSATSLGDLLNTGAEATNAIAYAGYIMAILFYLAIGLGGLFAFFALAKSIRNPVAIGNELVAQLDYQGWKRLSVASLAEQKEMLRAKKKQARTEAIEEGALALSQDRKTTKLSMRKQKRDHKEQKRACVFPEKIAYGCYVLSILICVALLIVSLHAGL